MGCTLTHQQAMLNEYNSLKKQIRACKHVRHELQARIDFLEFVYKNEYQEDIRNEYF